MDFKRFDLTHGVSFGIVDTNKFKINDLWLSFTAPLKAEDAALDSLLPLVLSRGTGKLAGIRDISRRLDDLYAATVSPRGQKRAETHFFGFFASMLDDSFAPDGCDISGGTLSVVRDMLTDPARAEGVFRPEYVEGEKKVLCSYIASEINNKRRYAYRRCIEEMCAGEPYGISDSGTVGQVMSVTPEMLWEHYMKVVSECHVEGFYVGRYSDDMADGVSKLIDGIGSPRKTDYSPVIVRRADKVRRVTEEHPVRQGKLCMGYRTGICLSDPDYYKYTVFNAVFGASPVSKLFMNVREKLSLAYSCGSSTASPHKGIMVVSAGIDKDNRDKTEEEVARQLEAIVKGEVSDSELEAAKATIVNAYRECEDSPASLEEWYTGRMMAGRSDPPADNVAKVMSVTKEDLSRVAGGITLDTVYFMEPTMSGGEGDDDE